MYHHSTARLALIFFQHFRVDFFQATRPEPGSFSGADLSFSHDYDIGGDAFEPDQNVRGDDQRGSTHFLALHEFKWR
jgi:hypothetical protein